MSRDMSGEAGRTYRWTGGPSDVSGLDAVRDALRDFGQAAVRLADALSALMSARKEGEYDPHRTCPSWDTGDEHDLHAWMLSGTPYLCPGLSLTSSDRRLSAALSAIREVSAGQPGERYIPYRICPVRDSHDPHAWKVSGTPYVCPGH